MKTPARTFTAWLLLFIGLTLAGPRCLAEMIDYPTPASIAVGDGYDFLLKKWKTSPFASPKGVEAPQTAESSTILNQVETSQDVQKVLDVNSDNEFGVVVSGSVSAHFFRENELHQYAMNFVVRSKCLLTGKMLESPGLNPQAKEMLAKGDLLGFRSLYGDFYVKTIIPGGMYFGLIQIQNDSTVETEKLKAKAHVQGPTWSSRNDFLQSAYVKDSSNSLKTQSKMSGIILPEPGTPEAMIAFASAFSDKVKQAGGTPLKVEIRPFSDFPEYKKVVDSITLEKRQALQRLSNHFIDYRLLLDDLNFALAPSHATKFDFDMVSRVDVERSRNDAQSMLQKIESLSERLFKGEIDVAAAELGVVPMQQFSSQLKMPREQLVLRKKELDVYPLNFVTAPPGTKQWDHDMDGNSPTINISANLVSTGKRLSVHADVKMRENKKDWTTFAAGADDVLLDLTGTGLRIERFSPESGSLQSAGAHDDHEFREHQNGSGLIRSAFCRTDVKHQEDGQIGAKPIRFNDIRITLERDGR